MCLGVVASCAQAWDSPGHITVAKIAYDATTPNARKKIDQLAKSDELVIRSSSSSTPMRYNGVNFAAWPDDIKHADATATPYAKKYGNWHFMDLSIAADAPDLFKNSPPAKDTAGNAYVGIRLCLDVLRGGQAKKNPTLPNEAVALALLCHLVGDIHQPLHCATHYLPVVGMAKSKSDGGGNAVPVLNFLNKYAELHQLWDTGYRSTYNPKTSKVEVPPDFSTFGITNTSPELLALVAMITKDQMPADISLTGDYLKRWIQETHGLAVSVSYGQAGPLGTASIAVSPIYAAAVKAVTQRQLYVAGMRLATLLSQIYP